MAIITSYPLEIPEAGDYLVGSKINATASRNPTKNFTVQAVVEKGLGVIPSYQDNRDLKHEKFKAVINAEQYSHTITVLRDEIATLRQNDRWEEVSTDYFWNSFVDDREINPN